MSTLTLTAPSTTRPRYRLSTKGVLHAEWTKFWSLRSSWITLAVSLFLLVAFGVIAAITYDPAITTAEGPPGQQAASDAVGVILTGATFASLAIGVLGVLMSAGEYTTGSIRSTLAAIPSRLPVLWSKATVFGAIALVATTIGAFAAFALGNPQLNGQDIALSLTDDGVVRSLLGAGLYLGLVGILGVALGALLRSSAGAITVLAGVLLIVPGLTSLLPDSWSDTISPYLPSNAGSAVMSLTQSSDSLGPWTGLAVFAGWVAIALAAAAYRLVRSDA
ncbi:ABC transporter permease subunit [Phytohabitans rumicis]|uniref:ABC transporter permease n=1 Tax=Phytohabitans rumicis TaxID=1076125 RepID=A0A6V8KMZ5_9ACTN|nr:ABC transporter permease subunit [Phytohabitans rumicis]GFJ86533.1 ABC transporter permease [Phytohabitans rumicis]